MSEENKQAEEKPQSTVDDIFSWFSRSVAFFKHARKRLQNLEQANMELGIIHMKNGDYYDAALRFKFVCWKNPQNFIAQYLKGKAYVYAGKPTKAIAPLKIALANNPDLGEAKFLLAASGQNITINEIPPSLLIEHLDSSADTYDENVVANSKVIPVLSKVIKKHFAEEQGFDTLHLDCRSGDAPAVLVEKSNRIVGIDPSLRMISKARDKRINDRLVYNELLNKTAKDYLQSCEQNFDIILSAHSFLNYGKLDSFFEKAQEILKKDGVFIFNTSQSNGSKYMFDVKNMLFTHSPEYINELADEFGFEIISRNEISYESSVNDTVFLLKKK